MSTYDTPATLVAIIVAAHRAGDRELEREARRRLVERYGIRLTFSRDEREPCKLARQEAAS